MRYTLQKEPFPNPLDPVAWWVSELVPLSTENVQLSLFLKINQKNPDPLILFRRSNMILSSDISLGPLEYKTQYAFIDALYDEVGVIVKGKTHGPRRAGARILEERG